MTSKSIDNQIVESESKQDAGLSVIMRRVFWLILIAGVFGAAYFQLIRDDVFPIQEIKISGKFENLKTQDMQPIITRGVKGNFFTVDVSNIYTQLVELPWVEKVWIHRIWPNVIKIDFIEQEPVAILNDLGLINQNGEVFSQNITPFVEVLPQFFVAENYIVEAIKQFDRNKEILRNAGLKPRTYYYDERKSQKIVLASGVELILGRMDVEQRLVRFVDAYQIKLKNESRPILKVDLRYTNGVAIDWLHTSANSQSLIKIKTA